MTEHTPSDELSADDHLGKGRTPARAADGHAPRADWNPRGPRVRRDPLAAYDALRSHCPVARGPDGAWTVFSHADVMATVLDHTTFSNAVSRHLQVPNGMDGAVHSAYRAVVDRYFTPQRMRDLEPVARRVATELVATLDVPGQVDAVAVGARFAVRAQSAWLGWPTDLEEELLGWVEENRRATRSRDRSRTAAVAQHFTTIITSLTAARRGDDAPADVTTELVRDRVDGRPLTDEEVVSILRNWTGGDLTSMALCAGVVLTYLADHPDLQAHVRAGLPDRELDRTIDEILRLDDPFVSNRRIATEPVTIAGRQVAAGDQVIVNWTAANRDPRIVGDPDTFDPDTHAPYNLVWGIGKHVCPGRPLATLELRALTRAVLAATTAVEPDPDRPREREQPPAGGLASAPLVLR
ncbi:cytochrome P450 [Cellulomonas sp. S1-8]|uniref:cytochrome P450 n=1 Tax=Cellulomonas sp. S1-8 TaxID=2904790 RepID=UPI002243809D|nr:cytochrome P450 [Cellulomonas sp. S1-8]UZN03778.1 cytochrome P450 [Cellulomonas sp. S1-8]